MKALGTCQGPGPPDCGAQPLGWTRRLGADSYPKARTKRKPHQGETYTADDVHYSHVYRPGDWA